MPNPVVNPTPQPYPKSQSPRFRHSIRARLLVSLGGTLLITLAIVVMSLYTLATNIERTSWQERQVAATRLAEMQLQSFIEQVQRGMTFINNNLARITIAGRFIELTNTHPAFMELVILDASGQIIIHNTHIATSEFDPALIPQTIWYQQAINGTPNTLYLDEIKFSDQNVPYLVVATPTDAGGMIAISLNMAYVGDVLANIRFGETGQAYFAEAGGAIFAHTDATVVLERASIAGYTNLPRVETQPIIITAPTATTPLQTQLYTNFQGMQVLGTMGVVTGTDWIIFTEIAESEIFAASRQIIFPLMTFVTLFWGGVMLTTSWVIGNLIFKPLKRLSEGQQAIAEGNFATVVVAQYADEMGKVIAGFNQMAHDLQQRIAERQAAESRAQYSQNQMQQAVDSLNGAIYQFSSDSTDWKLDYISVGIEKLTGIGAAAAQADFFQLIKTLHPDDKKSFLNALQNTLQTLSSRWAYEGRLIHAQTGNVRWFRVEAKIQVQPDKLILFRGVVLDITDRKRIENVLRLNSKAVETSPVGIVIADAQQPDMPLVYVNAMFQKMTGYSPDEALGKNCRFLQGRDTHQPEIDAVRDAIQQQGETSVSLRNYRKDGTMFWNELSLTPIYDEAGVLTHYLGIQNDITERKQSEEKMYALYQVMSESVLTLDEQLNQVLAIGAQILGFELGIISRIDDDTYTVLYGHSPDNTLQVGQTFDFRNTYCDLTYQINNMITINDMQQSVYSGHPCYTNFGLEAYIGIPLHVLGRRFGTLNFSSARPRATPLTPAEENFFLLMAKWVSTKLEQKYTDEALRTSEANLRSILDNSPAVITRTTPNLEIEFLRVPGAAPNLLDTLIGRSFLQFTPLDYHPVIQRIAQQVIQERRTLQYQSKNYDPRDGTDHWYNTNVAPVIEDDRVVSLLLVSTDITERKLAEQQIYNQNISLTKTNHDLMIARKQAEEASRLKSQFLATMSHELRTPLNAIIGYTQLQLGGMTGDLTPEQTEFQQRVLANGQHLLQLINEVLDLAKIESGRVELAQTLFNLRDTLQEVVTQNIVLADAKGLAFGLQMTDDFPVTIRGDSGRIKQILINLVSNAIKFTDVGSVQVEAALYDETHWRVTIIDTGIGIAPHLYDAIFEEFRQLDDQMQRGGTGLGLPIARKLAQMMGGDIYVSSQEGQGSQFTLLLPLVMHYSTISNGLSDEGALL